MEDFTGITFSRGSMLDIERIRDLNREIFGSAHIINTFARRDLTILIAESANQLIGFKIGYGLDHRRYYSAKGGIRKGFRRRGIAQRLLDNLIVAAQEMEYREYYFDTFPNMNPGMAIMAFNKGFRLVDAGFSEAFQDYRLRFVIDLRSTQP